MIEFQGRFDSNVTNSMNKRTFKRMWWMFAICSSVFILLGALSVAFPEDSFDTGLGIFFICFGALFTPIVILLTKVLQKRLNKSMSILSPDTTEIYQFYPDKLVITQRKGEEYEAVTTAKYSYLFKVEETPSTYFLFISKMQSHVVNKADLTQGSLAELNSILSQNLGTKFKQK